MITLTYAQLTLKISLHTQAADGSIIKPFSEAGTVSVLLNRKLASGALESLF